MRILRTALGCFVIACACLAGTSLVQRAPADTATRRNPFEGSEMALLAGAKLYARECAECHGTKREGAKKVPPLSQPEVYNATPETLFWVLRNGSLRRGMPSFAHLPEPQRWQIITFLRSVEPR